MTSAALSSHSPLVHTPILRLNLHSIWEKDVVSLFSSKSILKGTVVNQFFLLKMEDHAITLLVPLNISINMFLLRQNNWLWLGFFPRVYSRFLIYMTGFRVNPANKRRNIWNISRRRREEDINHTFYLYFFVRVGFNLLYRNDFQ